MVAQLESKNQELDIQLKQALFEKENVQKVYELDNDQKEKLIDELQD